MTHRLTCLVALLPILICTTGCTIDYLGNAWAGTPLIVPGKPYPVHKLTVDDIIAIARKTVAERETWIEQAEFEKPLRETDDSGWYVIVWRLTKMPGGLRGFALMTAATLLVIGMDIEPPIHAVQRTPRRRGVADFYR